MQWRLAACMLTPRDRSQLRRDPWFDSSCEAGSRLDPQLTHRWSVRSSLSRSIVPRTCHERIWEGARVGWMRRVEEGARGWRFCITPPLFTSMLLGRGWERGGGRQRAAISVCRARFQLIEQTGSTASMGGAVRFQLPRRSDSAAVAPRTSCHAVFASLHSPRGSAQTPTYQAEAVMWDGAAAAWEKRTRYAQERAHQAVTPTARQAALEAACSRSRRSRCP